MHWSILFTWLLLLAWTCSTAFGFFWIGWFCGRVRAEAILEKKIVQLRDEYSHTDGKLCHEYCIMIRTIKECKGLI